jgi:hypothetical protein
MTHNIRVGTIDELLGVGEEWLIDRPTRSLVLAKFFNGSLQATNSVDCDAPTKLAGDC